MREYHTVRRVKFGSKYVVLAQPNGGCLNRQAYLTDFGVAERRSGTGKIGRCQHKERSSFWMVSFLFCVRLRRFYSLRPRRCSVTSLGEGGRAAGCRPYEHDSRGRENPPSISVREAGRSRTPTPTISISGWSLRRITTCG